MDKTIDLVLIMKKLNIKKEYIQWACDNIKYLENIEDIACFILEKNPNMKDLEKLKTNNLDIPCFKKYIIDEEEYINFLNNPEVEEGIFTCSKCKSKKIYKFSKQTRASDEPTTVFATCTSCKNKWIIN